MNRFLTNGKEYEIFLASASPRRRELLAQVGLEFQVLVSDVEEKAADSVPWKMVEELSSLKAGAVLARLMEDGQKGAYVVIGADTVVALEGEIMGKPGDAQEAAEMLSRLQGKTHQVYTGVTFAYVEEGKRSYDITFHEKTEVTMYPMSREEILAYVDTGEPMDKAGAYGIQGRCAAYIKGICGDYNNVVGLPVGRLCQELQKISRPE